ISTLQAAFDEDHTWVARRGRRVAQRAAESGNFEVLKWAVAQGCKLSDRVSIAAAANGGDIEMLLFLIHAKCPFPKKISAPCEEAASEGNLEVLGLLRQMDCQWGEGTSTAAARNGHLHVLQWTRSQDPPCPWNEQTCAMAALSGHLQLIQWARSNGCPWDEATTLNAAHKGHLTVFQWAVENGC
ncbi:unnamed protein product, partial [Sphacelaria rigidula]